MTSRSTIFCFLGGLSDALYGKLPAACARRSSASEVPGDFAFLAADERGVRYRLGGGDEVRVGGAGGMKETCVTAFSEVAAGLKRDAPVEVYLVECLADPMGLSTLFSLAGALRPLNGGEAPPYRLRGVFSLLSRSGEADPAERQRALKGLNWLEAAMRAGILRPSVVVDPRLAPRPVAPVDLLAELLIALSDGRLADRFWGLLEPAGGLESSGLEERPAALRGLGTFGLAHLRFDREELAAELERCRLSDLRRSALDFLSTSTSSAAPPAGPSDDACGSFLADQAGRGLSREPDGARVLRGRTVEWLRTFGRQNDQQLGRWLQWLKRLRQVADGAAKTAPVPVEDSQAPEGAPEGDRDRISERQPQRFWKLHVALSLPAWFVVLPALLGAGWLGSLAGAALTLTPAGFLVGGCLGAAVGLALGFLLHATWGKETLELGRLPHGRLEGGYPPGAVKKVGWLEHRGRARSGVEVECGAELLEEELRAPVGSPDAATAPAPDTAADADTAPAAPPATVPAVEDLAFIARELARMEQELEEFRVWLGDPARAEEPESATKLYAHLHASKRDADQLPERLLVALDPATGSPGLQEVLAREAKSWTERALKDFDIEEWLAALEIPRDALRQRLAEASRVWWPGADHQGFSLRSFSGELAGLAEADDLRRDGGETSEALSLRILGGVSSRDLK
jgi:hypothetical protein